MPLYINDDNEVKVEDDSPLPSNTPATGSLSKAGVVEYGNRVLELIEKHKKEIQTRMAKRGNSFRGMLERELESRNKRLERSHSPSREQAPPDFYAYQRSRQTPAKDEDESVRMENDHPNLGAMSSEEYFDPPGITSAHDDAGPVRSRAGKHSLLQSQSPNSSNHNVIKDKVKKGSILKQYTRLINSTPIPVPPGTVDDSIYEPDEEDYCFCCEDEANANNNNRVKSRIQFKYPPEIPSDTTRSVPAMRRSQSQIDSTQPRTARQGGRTIQFSEENTSDEEAHQPKTRVSRERRSNMSSSGSHNRFSEASSGSRVNVTNVGWLDECLTYAQEHMLEIGALVVCIIILCAIFIYTKDYNKTSELGGREEYEKPKLFKKYKKPVM